MSPPATTVAGFFLFTPFLRTASLTLNWVHITNQHAPSFICLLDKPFISPEHFVISNLPIYSHIDVSLSVFFKDRWKYRQESSPKRRQSH